MRAIKNPFFWLLVVVVFLLAYGAITGSLFENPGETP
jgi:hypothetical protein